MVIATETTVNMMIYGMSGLRMASRLNDGVVPEELLRSDCNVDESMHLAYHKYFWTMHSSYGKMTIRNVREN